MKLVEGAKVASTPINNTEIGINQVVIEVVGDTTFEGRVDTGVNAYSIVDFLDTNSKPGKNKEEKTYAKDGKIVAYVPETVEANLASLQNKVVDVIFGKNNEVAYINVVDDATNGLFVTAWKYDATHPEDSVIELDGEEYEFDPDATVSLFGTYALNNLDVDAAYTAPIAIRDVVTTLGVAKADRNFNRTVSASIVLNEDGEIKAIDFVVSQNFAGEVDVYVGNTKKEDFLGMEEAIVKNIVAKTGTIKTINGASEINNVKLEKLEEDDVRVIKNGELVSVDEIEAGNVLTLIIEKTTSKAIKTIFVSDATVAGTLDKVKNDVLTIDGEEYNQVVGLQGNTDGDIEEISSTNLNLVEDYLDENVEVYLNFMGEISAILCETEAVPATLGVVTKVYDAREDVDADVYYLPVKILTGNDAKAVKYSIYNAEEDKDLKAVANLAEGAVVWFSADSNGIIEYDAAALENSDLLVVADKDLKAVTNKDSQTNDITKFEVDGEELEAKEIAYTAVKSANDDRQEVTVAGTTDVDYMFDDNMTAYFNTNDTADIEIIKGWASLVNSSDDTVLDDTTSVSFILHNDKDEVVLYVGKLASYASTTTEYAIVETVASRKDEDGRAKYYVTLVDDDTEYEVNGDIKTTVGQVTIEIEEGDFVSYTISNDKITVTEVIDAWEYANAKDEDTLDIAANLKPADGKKGNFEVKEVYGRKVYFVDYEDNDGEFDPMTLVKTAVTVYDLDAGTVEIVNVSELNDEIAGRYVIGLTADTDNGTNIDTIVIF